MGEEELLPSLSKSLSPSSITSRLHFHNATIHRQADNSRAHNFASRGNNNLGLTRKQAARQAGDSFLAPHEEREREEAKMQD